MTKRLLWLGTASALICACMATACGGGGGAQSGGDNNSPDEGTYNGGDSSSPEFDGGLGSADVGTPGNDATTQEEGGSQEAGQAEGGANDATTDSTSTAEGGSNDAGTDSTSTVEAGASDAGTDGASLTEAGGNDAGTDGTSSTEAGGNDAGGVDSGADTGTAQDGAVVDAGSDTGVHDAAPDVVTPATYTLGGTVSNLGAGNTVTLLNGSDSLPVTTSPFTFDVALANAATYAVTVTGVTGPVPQTCAVTAGASGTVAGANVTGVVVTCTNTYTLGGTVSNLGAGNTVTLLNGSDSLPVTTSPFTFDVALANAATYAVTVTGVTGPVPQTCAVTAGGSGTISGANVTGVVVTCTNTYTVGGMLAGLTVGESIVLQDLAGDVLTLSQNGPFVMQTPVAVGTTYGVTIETNPSTPIAQTCSVANGGGTMGGAVVNNVTVDCDMLAYFPFTGNANDASGYGNNGVVTNATLTADQNGVANSAYAFDGTAYIDAAMPTGFLPNGDASRTLTAWLQPTQNTYEWGVVYWGTGNCDGLQFGIGDQTGDQATFWGGCDDFVSSLVIPVSTVATPAWTFVAMVYSQDTNTTITVYVNDTSTQGTINDLVTPATSDFIMGADLINNAYFTGNLDSIRVYGHALSAAEVESIYTSGAP
jgi:hypothetical protein